MSSSNPSNPKHPFFDNQQLTPDGPSNNQQLTTNNAAFPNNRQPTTDNRQLSAIVAGMISGTSADAINLAIVRFEETLSPTSPSSEPITVDFELLAFQEFPLSPDLRRRILEACANQSNTRQICELNFEIGEAFAKNLSSFTTEDTEVSQLLTQNSKLKTSNRQPATDNPFQSSIDLIASHGQTIWHQVEEGGPISTLQIGEAAIIAERTGITVGSGFRVADIAASGQGAPLVSFFDYVFFADDSKTRALQNIGGIGNVTFLLAGKGPEAAWAFDTGPGNMLLDFAAQHYTQGQQNYDKDGLLAAAGTIDNSWLDELMSEAYFRLKPPKSTGRELFGFPFWQKVLARAEAEQRRGEDVLATLTAFTARSIARSYINFGPKGGIDEVIVSGGGALNPTLLARLAEELGPQVSLKRHDEFGLAAEAKEAVAFALFGYELLRGRAANLPSCTGASRPVKLGQLTPGQNFVKLMQEFAPIMAEDDGGAEWQKNRLERLRLKPRG